MAAKAKAEITISDILDGKNGKGIKSTAITYQASASGTTAPTGNWSTDVPSVPQGQYLWSRTIITYTDNTTSTTYSVAYIPKNGTAGSTGTGIASIAQQYYLSTSKTSQTGGTWVTSMPTWSSGKYLWTRYQITYKNPTSTAYTSPICDSSWEAVNEVQVGGRNLVLNSNFSNGFKYWTPEAATISIVQDDTYKSTLRVTQNEATYPGSRIYQANLIKNRELYTLSFYAKADSDIKLNQCIAGTYYPVSFNLTTSWQKFTRTFNSGESSGSLTFYASGTTPYQIANIKLELGNKATDWTPAPEDIDQNIQNAQDTADKAQDTADNAQNMAESNGNRLNISEATIKMLSDKICSIVTDENGSSVLTQTSSGFEFNLSAVEQNISKAANDLNNLSGTVNEVDNAINNLNKVVDDLGKKTAYIVMTTDENGDPCIELGKEGNLFKVRITNTSVDFLEGTSKIAYVNNKSLYIEKAVVKTELQIGENTGFIWATRSNGNMGLRKFG